MKLVTAEEMRRIDRRAIEELGIPGIVLMENAGAGVIAVISDLYGPLEGLAVTIICGKGNNGGDGFVVARHLVNAGAEVEVFLLDKTNQVKGDAGTNLHIALDMGVEVTPVVSEADLRPMVDSMAHADVIVDAIFGTGFIGPAEGLPARVIELINQSSVHVVSVDLPSGLSADDGACQGSCVIADATATMCLPKRGLFLFPGRERAGEVSVVDIGVPQSTIDEEELPVTLIDEFDLSLNVPARPESGHKGTFGHLVVLAGSVGLTGAAAMSSLAALRVGCGLVTLGTPLSLNDILEVKVTEVMTRPLPETESRTLACEAVDGALDLAHEANALVVGPGLSQHPDTVKFVLEMVRRADLPLVLDADGINALASDLEILRERRAPTILTPHPGELSRLIDIPPAEINATRIDTAQRVARERGLVCVLKGAPTVIADPDGNCIVNTSGSSALATAGSGDVLTGAIGGFLAQGVPPVEAAKLGVYLHGLAGDLAADELSPYSVIAGDVLKMLPKAIMELIE